MTRLTTQGLVDLVLNPREAGYDLAARERGPHPPRRWYDRPAVVLGCFVAGFILVVGYVHTNRGAPEAAKVHDSLVARVRAAQDTADGLQARVAKLDADLASLRSSALSGSGGLAGQLQTDEALTGQAAVRGPGVEVTLREPAAPSPTAVPGRGGTVPQSATHILTDRDLRSVVNELWADGAEAIAVNGIRLTPGAAIRFAGEAILVDLQPVTSPYVIDAVGDPNSLITAFAGSETASRYNTLKSAEGIGFSFTESRSLTLPGDAAVGALRYATVPPAPPASPSSASPSSASPSPRGGSR